MAEKTCNVLFLCTANSARSVIAESLLKHWGRGRFCAFSAGSYPRGTVNPLALEILEHMKLPTEGLRSKSWDEFARPGAPRIDYVITVCDNAAGETCPVWPGHPVTAHWGIPDPAAAEGSQAKKMLAFREALGCLENRIKAFIRLPLGSLDRMQLRQELDAIAIANPPATK